jgi:RNA-directed DNA polymerase
MMEAVVERKNMRRANKRVVGNKGADGVEAMTITELKPFLQAEWARIREELLSDTYTPSPVLRVEIPKPSGKRGPQAGYPHTQPDITLESLEAFPETSLEAQTQHKG